MSTPEEFAEKMKWWRDHGTFGVKKLAGTSKTWVVRNENDGGVAGTQTEHWDGRLDATVTPKTATLPQGDDAA